MQQKFENLPPNSDDIDNECQHTPLNCLWTITPENETSNSRHYMLEMDLRL